MQFWFEKSDKETGTAYVAAEHEGVSAFGTLHIGKRELVEAAGAVGMAAMLRKLAKRTSEVRRTQKEAQRRLNNSRKPRKDPRRSTGMNLNGPLRLGGRKRR